MSAWLNEFKAKLVSVLEVDDTLVDRLATDEAIYYQQPDQAAAFPCVVYDLEADYDPAPNKPGKHAVRLTLSAYAADPDVLDSIEEDLRRILDDHASALTTAHWRCGKCRLRRATRGPEPTIDPATQQPLLRLISEWDVWLYAAS